MESCSLIMKGLELNPGMLLFASPGMFTGLLMIPGMSSGWLSSRQTSYRMIPTGRQIKDGEEL